MEEDKPKHLMIGKDGDIAYFIKIDSENDLGALACWK